MLGFHKNLMKQIKLEDFSLVFMDIWSDGIPMFDLFMWYFRVGVVSIELQTDFVYFTFFYINIVHSWRSLVNFGINNL